MREQLASRMIGDYRVERLLGKSQLGAAYLAVEPARGTRVMITTFTFPEGQEWQVREQFRVRFAREGAELTRLVHTAIVPIYASGEQENYLYLVTAYVKEVSLGQILQQNSRLAPQKVFHVLKQLASGLDYAHRQGVVHGMLSLSNIVVTNDLEVGIAGFGLRTMLEMHGNGQSSRPLAHLSSAQGAFLGSPEYIAPERVLGLACDPRSDVYALGIMAFALLSGSQPFHASTPLDIALQRLQQPVPLLHAVCPTVPEAFDMVIGHALERDPARRFQSAGELAGAFERVLRAQNAAQAATLAPHGQQVPEAQMTMPPTVNWFDEQVTPTGRWQVAPLMKPEELRTLEMSPYSTEKMAAPAYSTDKTAVAGSPYSTEKMSAAGQTGQAQAQAGFAGGPSGPEKKAAPGAPQGRAPLPGASLAGIDPFAWWSSHAGSRKPLSISSAPASEPARRSPLRLSLPGLRTTSRPNQQERRKIVMLGITGTVAAGALTIGAIGFAHLTESIRQSAQLASASRTTPTVTSTQPAGKATPAPTKPAQTPTKPAQTPTRAPSHTGTVIGSAQQTANSSHLFSNPADGVSSLLIRLSNGNFVACERTCTHEGVLVNYDPQSKLIVCPAHGAVFDPKNGFSHVSGPGNGPLPRITIHVNGDGTVTTG